MAAKLELARLSPTLGTESTLDLLDADGFKVAYGGWQQGIASGLTAAGNVTETIPLRVQGSSHNDLAAKIDMLDDKLRQAEWYFDNFTEKYSVWLRAKMENESNARQALIRRGSGRLGSSLLYPPAQPGNMLRGYTLSLERYPWWEATVEGMSGVIVSCSGGDAFLADVTGNIPARIGRLKIIRWDLSVTLAEVWLGFRSDRFGTASNFQSVWQCQDGTAGTDTSIGGSGSTTTFAGTTTMATRLTIELEDVTSNYTDQRGEFIVLLAAHVTNGTTTCHVRLKDGYSGASAANWRVQDRVRIHQQTSGYLFSLGTVKIPPMMHDRSTSAVFRKFALRIDAEQTAGTGYLVMDRLILIPFSEGALHIDGAAITNANNLYIETSADGIVSGWQWSGSEPSTTVTVEPLNYGLPIGVEPRVVFAGQTATTFYPTATASVSIQQYYPRWRTLRGSA